MKTLKNGEFVKMNRGMFLAFRPLVEVGTLEAYYAAETPAFIADRIESSLQLHRSLAWTLQHSNALTSNYAGKAAELAKKAAQFDSATVLEDGEVVTVEGRVYAVRYMGDYSDPIHFIPVVK